MPPTRWCRRSDKARPRRWRMLASPSMRWAAPRRGRASRSVPERVDERRRERVRFVVDFSREATDTMLAGADPVAGTLKKLEPVPGSPGAALSRRAGGAGMNAIETGGIPLWGLTAAHWSSAIAQVSSRPTMRSPRSTTASIRLIRRQRDDRRRSARGAGRGAQSGALAGAGSPLSPLDGVPLTIKDNLFAAGLPATWGSARISNFRPGEDEPAVARLRAAGAIILGKTNVPEFTVQGYTSNALFGTTFNPRALAARRAARPAAALPRSRQALVRSRSAPTAEARFAAPRRIAAFSRSSRRSAKSPASAASDRSSPTSKRSAPSRAASEI